MLQPLTACRVVQCGGRSIVPTDPIADVQSLRRWLRRAGWREEHNGGFERAGVVLACALRVLGGRETHGIAFIFRISVLGFHVAGAATDVLCASTHLI